MDGACDRHVTEDEFVLGFCGKPERIEAVSGDLDVDERII
jgi:hypothetical protein